MLQVVTGTARMTGAHEANARMLTQIRDANEQLKLFFQEDAKKGAGRKRVDPALAGAHQRELGRDHEGVGEHEHDHGQRNAELRLQGEQPEGEAGEEGPAPADAVGEPAEEWLSQGGGPDVDRRDQRDLCLGQSEIGQQHGPAAVEYVHDQMAERDRGEKRVEE